MMECCCPPFSRCVEGAYQVMVCSHVVMESLDVEECIKMMMGHYHVQYLHYGRSMSIPIFLTTKT